MQYSIIIHTSKLIKWKSSVNFGRDNQINAFMYDRAQGSWQHPLRVWKHCKSHDRQIGKSSFALDSLSDQHCHTSSKHQLAYSNLLYLIYKSNYTYFKNRKYLKP